MKAKSLAEANMQYIRLADIICAGPPKKSCPRYDILLKAMHNTQKRICAAIGIEYEVNDAWHDNWYTQATNY